MMKISENILLNLLEKKLTHIEHLEDELISLNQKHIFDGLTALISKLSTGKSSNYDVNMKFDGSPSLIAGYHPQTKQFFVATKSLFSKTPKFYSSVSDIEKNVESPGLKAKLIVAFNQLRKAIKAGIFQGDILYTREDLKTSILDKNKVLTFTPNTITYAVPYFGDMAKSILKTELGIVWHTEYTGKSLENLSANFKPDLSKIKQIDSIWSPTVNLLEIQSNMKISPEEKKFLEIKLKTLKTRTHSLSKFVSNIQKNPKLLADLKSFFNYRIRQQLNSKYNHNDFIEYVKYTNALKTDGLKTAKGKEKKLSEFDEYAFLIKTNSKYFDTLFELHTEIAEMKHVLLRKLNNYSTIGSYIQDKKTNPEGFVLVHKETNNIVKLVDRNEFSLSNFQFSKNRA